VGEAGRALGIGAVAARMRLHRARRRLRSRHALLDLGTSDGTTRFTISGHRPAGTRLVITTQSGPGGERALGIARATSQVPPCGARAPPAGSGPLGAPPVAGVSQGGP